MNNNNLKRKQKIHLTEQNCKLDSITKSDINKKLKIVEKHQIFLAFHLVTCGLQNTDLGRDETAILQLGFQLIDTLDYKILGGNIILLQASSLLDPLANPDKIHISVPAREMTELLSSPSSYSIINLQQGLNEIDSFIMNNISTIELQSIEIIPVTIGHLPLRSVLHRETRFRNIQLNSYWYHYYDLCDQVSSMCDVPAHNLEDISNVLRIDKPGATLSSIIWSMSTAIKQLLYTGHIFHSKHIIKCHYKPKMFHIDDEIDPDVVVMIKPIDYRTPISQIIPFFSGINIADGGIAVVMSDGRRSNKILVKFEDKIQRDISLLRDKHHMELGNTRFITISVHDGREFMKIAGYQDENVKAYLERIQNSDQILIRIKGLPYTVTKDEILNFFKSYDVEVQFANDGIFLVQKPSGDLNGDAFVIFENELNAQRAKSLKGMTIGSRYMEIFYSTPPEMNQVIAAANKSYTKTKQTKPLVNGNEFAFQNVVKKPSLNGESSACSATITKFVPVEATDLDFITYLGDYRTLCLKFSRSSTNISSRYISYIAIFNCSSDALIVVKALCDKPFRVSSLNKDIRVETAEFSISTKVEEKLNVLPQIIPKILPHNLPINNFLNILPYSSYILPQPANFSNTLNMTGVNGSLFNYNGLSNIYSPNLIPNTSLFMINQMPVGLSLGMGTNIKLLPNQDILASAMAATNSWAADGNQIPPTANSCVNKSKILYMSGIMTRLQQNDLDIIFQSIASNISMLPKLFHYNQFFYSVFNNSDDANIALQRCPIILYNNQVIQLIPASE